MRLLFHLKELDEALEDWKRYQSISIEEFRKNRDIRNMVLYSMLVAIQASIDIAAHIIAKKNLRRPTTYRETFEILAEKKIIPDDLANMLSDLAGFRNVLVHIYWEIDLEEVYSVLQNDLETLEIFKKVVKEFLEDEV